MTLISKTKPTANLRLHNKVYFSFSFRFVRIFIERASTYNSDEGEVFFCHFLGRDVKRKRLEYAQGRPSNANEVQNDQPQAFSAVKPLHSDDKAETTGKSWPDLKPLRQSLMEPSQTQPNSNALNSPKPALPAKKTAEANTGKKGGWEKLNVNIKFPPISSKPIKDGRKSNKPNKKGGKLSTKNHPRSEDDTKAGYLKGKGSRHVNSRRRQDKQENLYLAETPDLDTVSLWIRTQL